MNKLFCVFLYFLPIYLSAQTEHDGLTFSKTEFNFQKVKNWISTIDTVEVKNTSDKKIFVFKRFYSQEFEVSVPSDAINPGESGIIAIIYKPKLKGKFNISIPVYHSSSQTPVEIIFKGEVLSFDEYANDACPSFSNARKPFEFEMEIHVQDSVTKQPLSNSLIEIEQSERFAQHYSNSEGDYKQRSEIGYRLLYIEHPGYKSKTLLKNFNPKNKKVIVELVALAAKEKPILLFKDSVVIVQKEKPIQLFKDSIVIVQKEIMTVKAEEHPDFSLANYKENNIIFLIDISGSMNGPDRMPLLKKSMIELTRLLRTEDKLSIITYADEATVILAGVAGSDQEKIISVIQQLKCGGKTSGGKAISVAYENAEKNFKKQGVNQIALSTDGGFNGLADTEEELMNYIGKKAGEQIQFSVLAFGQNKGGKQLISQLANKGNGFYLFIGSEDDAKAKLTETIKLQSKIN
ncbi:MAG: hypothetical protein A3F72_14705 [Bacteroidetes bacterium RIFCSPLOWO2_12_FULL_35_15]|nr:MAG: hypothetical protein A3F72_14705 [Bacteroidetes bacterium RIFCSPLOWO2_12_FULL_35_15]